MTFEEENEYLQKIFNCMTGSTDSFVIQEMVRGVVRELWNTARRTDPDKEMLIQRYGELLENAMNGYKTCNPHSFKETAEEYFAEEIAFITAYEEEEQ